jgi:aerobic-type carbon monoxide dehydrogenase small subunit (CoxS/CutS family)
MNQDEPQRSGFSRRDFLKSAGLLAGGVAASTLAGCTKTVPAVKTSVYVCPICGQEFASLDAIQSHFATAHPQAGQLNADSMAGLNVNGVDYLLQVRPDWTLAFVLRDKLGLFGTKVGCDMGACGSCTVLADGEAVFACLMLAVECSGIKIQTIEGLSDGVKLSPVQQRFYDHEAFQCGFCTPGFIMAAEALLASNPAPTIDDARQALAGHLCTCGNFKKTLEAVVGS